MNKKRKIRILTLFLAITMLLSSAGVDAAKYSKGTKEVTSSVKVKRKKGRKLKSSEADKLTAASINLLNTTIKGDEENANVLISPVSIMFAFGLAENGAKGKTRKEIEKGVFGGMKTSDTNNTLCKMMRTMESDKQVKWNAANSIWIRNRKDVKVKKGYLKKSVSYYDAQIFRAPFNNGTVKDINKWVKKNTNKMIPEIIDSLDEETVMCLLNAVAFEGSWAQSFDKKQIQADQSFTNQDGSVSKVSMMTEKEERYFQLNGANGFKKAYKGGKYAYVGIEMPEGVKTADYISGLSENPGEFRKALSNMKNDRVVTVSLPKYELDYNAELTDTLKGVGVTTAFNQDKANLYNMFKKDKGTNYCFSKVLHKTHIEVDKNGTKAAAATAITVEKCTAVKDEKEKLEIKLDHPFVYAIIDTKTNMPLFIGCVNSME